MPSAYDKKCSVSDYNYFRNFFIQRLFGSNGRSHYSQNHLLRKRGTSSIDFNRLWSFWYSSLWYKRIETSYEGKFID